tara:strand:+ start:2090 stop:2458 length:369 start_codon:yes stop_codon:yes gene_type:complete
MIYEDVRATIATTAVLAKATDIAPVLLDRGATLPAITFDVRRSEVAEEVAGPSAGWMNRVEISCHAYTVEAAEELALLVVDAIDADTEMLVDSIERTWAEAYDENVVIRSHTINAIYRRDLA